VLLEYILINKNNKELFEKVAFCFATEEEIKNKGAIFFMKKYLPQNILIFDVFPECFI
jgi:putative aminopeptidase FrvX